MSALRSAFDAQLSDVRFGPIAAIEALRRFLSVVGPIATFQDVLRSRLPVVAACRGDLRIRHLSRRRVPRIPGLLADPSCRASLPNLGNGRQRVSFSTSTQSRAWFGLAL